MMDKTININLGGILFQIDEEAYRILKDYLQSINNKFKNVPGGNETIEDIESRIAEIFQSQKNTAGIISKENIDDMIRTIGKPEDFDQAATDTKSSEPVYGHPGPRKKMFRNPGNSIISGVCGGIGAYLNTDPVWIRVLFVVFAFCFGFGFLVYLALWIAIPSAANDIQKKEMYGGDHNWAMKQEWDNHQGSNLGHAINEVFTALGKVLFVIVRVILIAFGVLLVVTGFLALLTFVMVFIFKYPGSFSTDFSGMNLSYLPDFLNYIIAPKMVPWVRGLIVAVVSLPLLAIIYGGVRMIFWFRVRDGFVWLAGFLLFVMSAAALSIILFNEGVSYGTSEKSVTRESFILPSDTLYIIAGRKLSDLRTENEISVPDKGGNGYYIFVSDEKKEIHIKTHLDLTSIKDISNSIEIRRRSAGRNRLDAMENSKRLLYNYRVSRDTLYLDEFFTIPANSKFSFDYVSLNLRLPEGTLVHMDKDIAETLLRSDYNENPGSESKNGFWKMTRNWPDYTEQDDNNEK